MSFNIIIIIIIIIIIFKNVCNHTVLLTRDQKRLNIIFFTFTFMHLVKLLSKVTHSAFRLYIYSQYVCSLGIEPATFMHFLCSKGGSTISWIIFCLSFYHFHIVFLHFWIFIFITLSILYIKKWHTIYNRRYYNGSPSHYIASKP